MSATVRCSYDQVSRHWTRLSPEGKDAHARRLVGVPVAEVGICAPDTYRQEHYLALVTAALDGDVVAFAWLADSHRPLLLARGRTLLRHDPEAWSEVALEILHQGLRRAVDAAGPWSRRRVSLHLCSRMARAVRDHARRADLERATDPDVLSSSCREVDDPYRTVHPELTEALEQALARVAPAAADGLRAVARLEPLGPVARSYRIDEAALRQRMARARRQLRPQLASFARATS
jgi:hypothetical protein